MNLQPILQPLREISAIAAQLEPIVKVIVLVVAIILFAISVIAYLKTKSLKLMLVSIFFFLFMMKYILATMDIFLSPGYFFPATSQNAVDLVALLVLFFALFKK